MEQRFHLVSKPHVLQARTSLGYHSSGSGILMSAEASKQESQDPQPPPHDPSSPDGAQSFAKPAITPGPGLSGTTRISSAAGTAQCASRMNLNSDDGSTATPSPARGFPCASNPFRLAASHADLVDASPRDRWSWIPSARPWQGLVVAEGFEVVVLDVLLPAAHRGEPSYLNPDATYVRADVRDTDAVAGCLRGVDAVSHQAAMVGLGLDMRDAPDYAAHNDLGTAVLLGGARRRGDPPADSCWPAAWMYEGGPATAAPTTESWPRGLAPSSASGPEHSSLHARVAAATLNPESLPESAPPDPRSVYAATDSAGTPLHLLTRETGVPLTILRYHNVYGPACPADTPYSGVAAMFRSALAAGRAPSVFEDGAQRRDFIHVADVARANLLALADGSRTSHVCNIATGTPATVREMATTLCEATGGAVAPLVTGEFRLGDVRHVYACADRAQSVLGFRARISLPEGMRDFARAPLR